jgi:hypothetical protein
MIEILVGIESALLIAMERCRKRAAVLKTLTVRSRESAPVRIIARALAARAQSTTTMERVVAAKAATLIRGFVQTTAFDQLILSAIARIRSQCRRNRGVR